MDSDKLISNTARIIAREIQDRGTYRIDEVEGLIAMHIRGVVADIVESQVTDLGAQIYEKKVSIERIGMDILGGRNRHRELKAAKAELAVLKDKKRMSVLTSRKLTGIYKVDIAITPQSD